VLIALGQTTIEMSFWFALLLLLGGLLLLRLLWSLLRGSFVVTHQLSGALLFGSRERAQRRTANGLIDFIEGNWKLARKKLLRAAPRADTPLINYLAAARCAYELGDRKEALALLHRAETSSEHSELAVALTQARMQLIGKRYEQCLATLERVHRKAPQHPVVLDLLRQVYIALHDWDSLAGILDSLRAYGNSSADELRELEVTLHRERLKRAGEKGNSPNSTAEQVNALQETWHKMPGAMQKNVELVQVYVAQLIANRQYDEAENILRKTLSKNWHEPLVRLYGILPEQDAQRQLLVAEGWLKQRPADAVLMLTIGRLCLRNQQWGRAREYFQSSLQLHKDPETCAELARLLAHMGEHEKSTEYYQQGLLLTTRKLPELPMPKKITSL
jgi:HemY protein